MAHIIGHGRHGRETYPERRGGQGPQGPQGVAGAQGAPGTPSNFRTVASDTTTIEGGTGTNLGPFERSGTERWDLWLFPTSIVDESSWGAGQNNDLAWFFFHQAGDSATQMRVSFFNFSSGAMTFDWTILGYTP